MSNKKILLMALIFGLLTALALNFYLDQIETAATRVTTQKVLVAKVKIPSKTVVTREMLTLKELPKEFVHPDAVLEVEEVTGKVTKSDISAGEQVLRDKVVESVGNTTGFAYRVPLGMRAISVHVNDVTGVGGLLNPGDRVDVMGTIELEKEESIRTKVTHILLEDVEVLAIGRNYSEAGTVVDPQNKEAQVKPVNISNVTLAVPADKMQALTLMQDYGKVTLALRSHVDESRQNRRPFYDSQLLN